jgi:hypothetical protein
MDRMGKHTKQPEVLRELFAALGDDPFVIAECLVRPTLADRLFSNWFACDERVHGELKKRAAAELQNCRVTSSARRGVSRASSRPTVGDGVIFAASVERVGAVSSTPDNHSGAGPDCCVSLSWFGRVCRRCR